MSVAFPPCPECDGSGEVAMEDIPVAYMTCPSCGGRGVLITDELVEAFQESCRKSGRVWMFLPNAIIREGLVAVVEKLKENQQ